jgi:parallel beta-helix repeat protein
MMEDYMIKIQIHITVILLVTTSLLNISLFIPNNFTVTADPPPPSDSINGIQYIEGNWNISDSETYSDEIIILSGNLTILNGGNLTFNNVTLMMNCTSLDGEFNIELKPSGSLYILNGSMITDSPFDTDDDSAGDFEYMFWVRESSNFIMQDSELHESGWDWDNSGLTIETNEVLIKGSILSYNYAGLNISFSSNSILDSNIIFNNYLGIYMLQAINNTLNNNLLYNMSTWAIFIEYSSNNYFTGNYMYNNSWEVFNLISSSNNIIEQNSFTSNGAGIQFIYSSYNRIINNTIEDTINYGIYCYGSTYGNIIYKNTIRNHFFDGIRVRESLNSNISNNEIYNNNRYGIYLREAPNSSIENNTIYDNSFRGIVVDGSPNSTFVKNNIYNNSYGFHLATSNCTFTKNTIHDNLIYGMAVFSSSSDNLIINNSFFSNGDGISIGSNSNNNIFSNNRIYNNNKNGTYFFGNVNNIFINCSIINSTFYDISLNSDAHAIVLNTSFNKSKVYFDDDISTLTVQWFMNVYVNSSGGNPVRDVNINVYNISDELIAVGITDKNGFLRYIPVTERVQNSTMNTTFSPYNVTAIKGGSITYADPEPIINISKRVNITFFVTISPLHHITINPKGPETFVIGEEINYMAEGWNDVDEILLNTSWTPIWSVDNVSVAVINNGTGLLNALDLGNGIVNVTSTQIPNIYNTSMFTVILPPLHHIVITPLGPYSYYIGENVIYTAVGWNDAAETMLNLSWNPVWSVDGLLIASIDPSTGEFTSLSLGSSNVRVSDLFQISVFNVSAFSVIPWPLHHISINPTGPTFYYIEENQTYTAIGWNDPAETQQNFTWIPEWSVNNTSFASIDSISGVLNTLANGYGIVNVTDSFSQSVYNTSAFIILPYPIHHIDIIPDRLMRYYVNDEIIYTVIGWNDENESYQNTTWTPQWSINNSSIATIDPNTGEFRAIALGSGEINVTVVGFSGIYNTIQFTIEPWPLHHIEIIPDSNGNYYIGDTNTYSVIGWNDEAETQENNSWTPTWSIDDTSKASINSASGDFTALALGSSHVMVSATSPSQISNTSSFIVDPWPLHHISIEPSGPEIYEIGDIVKYSVIGWNDVEETQINSSWVPVWTLEGYIQELTFDGQEATFEAKKAGEGSIKCSDEITDIYVTSEIEVLKVDTDGDSGWVWILIIIVIIIILVIIFIQFYWKKNKEKNV